MSSWGEFAAAAPDLAAFGVERLSARPAYLATTTDDGAPRVHPVTPVFAGDGLYLFMEPASPKGDDLRARGRYTLHNGVPDDEGTGGEFVVSGRGAEVADRARWEAVAAAAPYDPVDGYVLFELTVVTARAKGYGDVELPATRRWRAPG